MSIEFGVEVLCREKVTGLRVDSVRTCCVGFRA